jgi:hypothetical protein
MEKYEIKYCVPTGKKVMVDVKEKNAEGVEVVTGQKEIDEKVQNKVTISIPSDTTEAMAVLGEKVIRSLWMAQLTISYRRLCYVADPNGAAQAKAQEAVSGYVPGVHKEITGVKKEIVNAIKAADLTASEQAELEAMVAQIKARRAATV